MSDGQQRHGEGSRETIDPITLAVIQNGLQQASTEADIAFERAAFSPVISEACDRTNGIYDCDSGEVISQGEVAQPIFIGTMQFAVQSILHTRLLQPGDVVIMNDPYLGGTHNMDVKLVQPYYYDGELFCYVANAGHWPDIGGRVPGSFSVTSTDILQEGLRIPPVRLYRQGELDDDVLQMILNNIRVPEERIGDLKAQLAALNVLGRSLTRLLDKYGRATVRAAIAELRDRSERMMRASLGSLPDGLYSFDTYLDNDGITDEPIRIGLDLKIEGSEAVFDFSRSSSPCRGPMNSVLSTTVSGVYIALKHIFRDIPINSGCFRPITVTVPDTTFLNAKYPRPVAGCAAEVVQRVISTVIGAVAQAVPDQLFGDAFGSIYNVSLGGFDPKKGRHYVLYNFGGGGYGGNPESDGLSNACATHGISKITPVEVLEQYYPIRFERYALHEGSAGAGRHRGGMGTDYTFRLIDGEAEVSLLGDRGKFPPFGVAGGKSASVGYVSYTENGVERRPLRLTKFDGVLLHPGDSVTVKSPGGGGYGDPFTREAELVLRDVQRGYITRDVARADYGVAIIEDPLRIDVFETERLRARGASKSTASRCPSSTPAEGGSPAGTSERDAGMLVKQ